MNHAQKIIRQQYKEWMFPFNYGWPRTDAHRHMAWIFMWQTIGRLYAAEDQFASMFQMLKDIQELLARAYIYDDKPHQLYSHIAVMGERYFDKEQAVEIRRLMDIEYMKDRS